MKSFIIEIIFQDEDVYTFFEPELPCEILPAIRTKVADPVVAPIPHNSLSKTARLKKQRSLSTLERRSVNPVVRGAWRPIMRDKVSLHEGSSVLDLKSENYFSCSVGRKQSSARYLLGSSDDVVALIKDLAECSSEVECLGEEQRGA